MKETVGSADLLENWPFALPEGWRPRATEDIGDGGAFPEITAPQYPLDMGKKATSTTSNALALQGDGKRKVKSEHVRGDNRIVHAS